ncbi:MAG: TonB-dependent receptor [Bacteroidales bacterium]|nr:TonB-dependent receptor [Bacteroidales bacterium]
MKIKITFMICFLMPFFGTAQNKVSGTITDKETGELLTGATVYVPELSKGAVAGSKGFYQLKNLPSGRITLEFSFIGFQTIVEKINLSGEDEVLNIELNPTIIQTQEVVISSSSYTTQHENAVKIETIGAKKIHTSGQPNIFGAISEIAGVDMITKGNGIAKPVIRGLSNSNVVVLNNGVKLENYQFSENHPFTIDEFGVERVEVIKGPASLLYGSDALGGLINIIPEKPASSGKIIGDFNAQYFSNTKGISTNMAVKGTGKSFFWGIRGGIKSHMDYTDGKGNTVFNSRFGEQSIKLNSGINKKHGSFQLFYNYNAMKPGMTTPGALALVDKNERVTRFWYQDLVNHMLSSKNKIFVGKYKIGANLAWQYNHRKFHSDRKNEVDMGLNVLSYDIKTWLPSSENTEYILGVQGGFKNNRNYDGHVRVLPDFTQNDLALLGWLKHTHKNNVSMQAGLRWEYRALFVPEQEKANHSHDEGNGTEAPEILEPLDRDYQNISFSLGGTWQMSREFLWRFNVASAYRTPNVAELTQDGVHASRYEKGNRNLKSQRGYEADLSMHFHSEILEFDVAGFYNHINQYIYLAPTNDYEDDLRIYQYTQGNANLYGLETFISIYLLPWLHVNTTYSYLRGEQQNGRYLPFIPQDKIKAEMKLERKQLGKLINPWFRVSAAWAFAQKHPAQFETETDAYTLLNAGLGFQLKVQNQFVELSITASNLLNEVYYDHLSTLKEMGLYNMGRNITFSIKVPFGIINKK